MDHKLARSNAETAGYPPARGERIALVVILGLYTILQLINIGHGGHMGQDWITHRDWLKDAATQPWDWLQGNFFQTDPPLYHLVMAPWLWLLRPRLAYEVMGLVNVLISLASLIVFWKILVILVESTWIRFAALLSVTFLPASVIGSVVIASDAFCQLPVCLLGLCFVLYASDKIRWHNALLIGTVVVACAVSLRATAIVLVPAFVLGLGVIARIRKSWSVSFFVSLALSALVTGSLGLYWNFRHPAHVMFNFQWQTAPGTTPPKLMNLRSALFFRSGDLMFFDAPSGWELYEDLPKSLKASNTLSYPGLLWLSLHTDILNTLQPHKAIFAHGFIGQRTTFARRISRVSVAIGFVTFCVSAIAVLLAALRAIRLYVMQTDQIGAAIIGILILAGGWLGTMTTIMLIVGYSYLYQYWHPRLILPAVMLFAIPVAWIFSQWLQGRRRLQLALLAGTACQTMVHILVVLAR
ncbi:MAG: hypothetical protein WBZ19_14930 [Chthoniobacterales bacterium]